MPKQERFKTKYQGVFFVEGLSVATGKPERIYYIRYRKEGKPVEEKAGRQYQNNMTPSKAARLRTLRIDGDQLSNKEMREKIAAEEAKENGRWTFDRLWEAYKASNPKIKGIVTDENRYENHLKPDFGKKEPKDIIPLDVDRLRVRLLKKRAPQTVKNTLELLRRIINFGVKKQLCPGPGFTIQLFKVNNVKTEDLTPEQLSNLISVLNNWPDIQGANFMKMALFTGMRRGELFKLMWEDIDFNQGFILIRKPKGGISQKIPLNADARAVLDIHPKTESPYIFPGRDGGPRKEIKRAANKIKEAAGLPEDFRAIHGLRHVYASLLASSGKIDLYTLQNLLTHKSPQMTQRYAHLRDEALRKASDLAGDLIRQQVSKGKKVISLRNSG